MSTALDPRLERPNLTYSSPILSFRSGGKDAPYTEHYALHGICLRLIRSLPPGRGEAMVVARWIARHPDIFGTVPAIIPAGRHRPGVGGESWHRLGDHLAERIAAMPEGTDTALTRLAAISARLDLAPGESSILGMLVLRRRGGPVAMFMKNLQQEIGLSAEAALGWTPFVHLSGKLSSSPAKGAARFSRSSGLVLCNFVRVSVKSGHDFR